jgi:phenylacetate-CoA ligase
VSSNQLARVRFEAYFLSMRAHAWLLRGLPTRRQYYKLKKSEYSTRSELTSLQSTLLQEIVSHHYATTPYFREQMDELGLTTKDFLSVTDLSKFPMLEKEVISKNIEVGFLSTEIPKRHLHKISTSGSTGKPFTIFADREQLEFRFAATLRAMEMTGWRFGDRQARLWHQKIGMTQSQILRERLDAWFHRRIFIPAFEMDSNSLRDFISRIEKHRPVLIDGYAESLNFIATYLKSNNTPDIRPIAVISSAQMLPSATRKIIEETLKTRVFDKYGSREFSGIAWQCEVGEGHHVVEESYIVELITEGRPSKPGELGEIVVTDLKNRAMPMFRYRIGDLAIELDNPYECACGRQSRRIGTIEGRTQSIVCCTNGRWLPGSLFLHYFKDFEQVIEQFQIYQSNYDGFELRIIKGPKFSLESFETIMQGLREFVGDTPIEIQFVDQIALVKTGKRSPVVSTLQYDFQNLS